MNTHRALIAVMNIARPGPARGFATVLVFVVWAMFPVLDAASQEAAETLFARGLEAEKAGRPDSAAKLFQSAAAGGVAAAYGRLGMLAAARGADKSAADWYEKGARACDGASQLGLALANRMGKGRKASGDLAYAWLIAAQRSKQDWTAEEVVRLADLERDIPAYMSNEKATAAYCLGLDLFINACGGHQLVTRLERWVYCR
ncbi:hypothetical protein MNBD_ALPHA09-1293 [hydrothermal vent metagenome]|uniref:Sel1 repeat family protein n=1 Tax=hydrothermal vent metagenome TaxID=652676 RepID=A0A3B0TH13_9ZZZZ